MKERKREEGRDEEKEIIFKTHTQKNPKGMIFGTLYLWIEDSKIQTPLQVIFFG